MVIFLAVATWAIDANWALAQPTASFTITYETSNGTVAPQYYETRRITIRSVGDSEFRSTKGTGRQGTRERKARFLADPAQLEAIRAYIRRNHLDVPPDSVQHEGPGPKPGDGSCLLFIEIRGNSHAIACSHAAVGPLLQMIANIVPPTVKPPVKAANPHSFAPPMTFGGAQPDYAHVSITLSADSTYELNILRETIAGPMRGSASTQTGRWSYDEAHSLVTLHPTDSTLKEASLYISASTPLSAMLQEPGLIGMRLALQVPTPIPDKRPPVPKKSAPNAVPAEHRNRSVREIAIRTPDGHWLTAADGGGYGGPDDGPDAVALHTDAQCADGWARFEWIWLDQSHRKFALRTAKGTYVTAVNGGGIGGPNGGRSPIHTDAAAMGLDGVFEVDFLENGIVTLRTRKDFYLTAVNGGGIGGPNSVPVHTDATSIGPWETFTAIFKPRSTPTRR